MPPPAGEGEGGSAARDVLDAFEEAPWNSPSARASVHCLEHVLHPPSTHVCVRVPRPLSTSTNREHPDESVHCAV